jgi:hypothetical protein
LKDSVKEFVAGIHRTRDVVDKQLQGQELIKAEAPMITVVKI